MNCTPVTPGWEDLGVAVSPHQILCPKGFEFVDDDKNVEMNCKPFKKERCCTTGHSGAAGDCEDMVIHFAKKQCAFVKDIRHCKLPKGWLKRPSHIEPYAWECPYSWLKKELECL